MFMSLSKFDSSHFVFFVHYCLTQNGEFNTQSGTWEVTQDVKHGKCEKLTEEALNVPCSGFNDFKDTPTKNWKNKACGDRKREMQEKTGLVSVVVPETSANIQWKVLY